MIKHRNKCNDPSVTKPSPDVDVDVDSSEPAAQSPKGAKKPPKPSKKKRQPDPIWDTVVSLWFPSGATGREKRIGKLVKQFKGVGATETTLRERHAMYLKHWPGIDCTPDALFKHWDQVNEKVRTTPACKPQPRERFCGKCKQNFKTLEDACPSCGGPWVELHGRRGTKPTPKPGSG